MSYGLSSRGRRTPAAEQEAQVRVLATRPRSVLRRMLRTRDARIESCGESGPCRWHTIGSRTGPYRLEWQKETRQWCPRCLRLDAERHAIRRTLKYAALRARGADAEGGE